MTPGPEGDPAAAGPSSRGEHRRSAGPYRRSRDPVLAALEGTLLGPDVTRHGARDLVELAVARGLAGVCLPLVDMLALEEEGWLAVMGPPQAEPPRERPPRGTPSPGGPPAGGPPQEGPPQEAQPRGEPPPALDRVTVANFPFGDLPEREALRVAELAWEAGATWIDVVFRRDRILDASLPPPPNDLPVRVIFETSAYDSESAMLRAAENLVRTGYRDLKTSTGFHPSQRGPQLDAVRALVRTFGTEITVKASGKIRTRGDALALLEAGASRLGASAVRALLP